jgi:phosphomannomutase
MATPAIKFGTDGWRAVIGDQYTFANLEIVSRATSQWLFKNYGDSPKVVIGHDTRFLGREFSEHVAAVMASQGIHVLFAETFTTTPSISWGAMAYSCSAGIVITASHNPPSYNGFKIKAHFGGPASPEMIAEVEAEYDELKPYILRPFAELVQEGKIEMHDVASDYLNLLREKLDIAAIKESGIKLAHDAMFGAGQGALPSLTASGAPNRTNGPYAASNATKRHGCVATSPTRSPESTSSTAAAATPF